MGLRIVLTDVYSWPEVARGGERYLHELAGALRAAGHDARILSTALEPRRATVRGVPVQHLRRRHVWKSRFGTHSDEIAFGAQTLAHLLPSGIDVWHAMGTPDAAAAAVAGRVRGVHTAYTDLGFPNRASRDRRPDRALHETVVRHIDHYICFSAAAGAYLAEGYGRRADVVPGGVDLERFTPGPSRSDTPALLFPADASEPRKNLALLLDAFALLRSTRPDVELWVAGRGDQAAIARAAPHAAQEGVVLLGDVAPDEMVDLYRRAWVTTLPSEAEAFGFVYIESLACGTPVVALDRGGPT